MKEIEYPVEIVKVRCFCNCGGEMVFTGRTLMSIPPQYPHKCNQCEKEEIVSDIIYPEIRYKEK